MSSAIHLSSISQNIRTEFLRRSAWSRLALKLNSASPVLLHSSQAGKLHRLDRSPYTQHQRFFNTAIRLLRKGGKEGTKSNIKRAEAKFSGENDAFDFSDYESAIAKAHENLKIEISKIKAGGRDVDAIESIRVNLGKGTRALSGSAKDKGGKTNDGAGARVGDLASVVQRGRNVVVMVGEKEHLKPVNSALASTLDLNPQPSTTPGSDPLHLTISIPPTTRESRQQASKLAHEKGEAAVFALREARGAQKKRLRAMELAKKVGPDELRRAEKDMEKVNEKANAEAKRVVEEARKRLEGG